MRYMITGSEENVLNIKVMKNVEKRRSKNIRIIWVVKRGFGNGRKLGILGNRHIEEKQRH